MLFEIQVVCALCVCLWTEKHSKSMHASLMWSKQKQKCAPKTKDRIIKRKSEETERDRAKKGMSIASPLRSQCSIILECPEDEMRSPIMIITTYFMCMILI